MLTLAVIVALLAGSFAVSMLLSWLLVDVCEWVFARFTEQIDSGIMIGDYELIENIINGLRERDVELADKLSVAVSSGNRKKMMLWQIGRVIDHVVIVDAKDVSKQDELLGKVTRFEKGGKILQY